MVARIRLSGDIRGVLFPSLGRRSLAERFNGFFLTVIDFEYRKQFRDLQQVSDPLRQPRQLDRSVQVLCRDVQRD